MTPFRVAVAVIVVPLLVWFLLAVFFWFGGSSSGDVKDVPLTTTGR